MACCYCCCGQAICSEGQQGKCCCGGVEGVCCDTGEYCCNGACQATPCEEECEVDDDCESCQDDGYVLVGPCSGVGDTKCCPPGSSAWIDDIGDPRFGRCIDDCAGAGDGSGAGLKGYCCNGACQETPCDEGCTCAKRGEGYTLAYVEEGTGYEICCPPGTTWNAVDLVCDCEAGDPQCAGDPPFVAPTGPDGFVDCGDFCVAIPEECPP